MQKKQLGNSDLNITSLGFGAWAIGGAGWEFSWGPQDDKKSIEAIHRALELGINWIDTAAVYGCGHSEEVVAKALNEWRGEKPYIFTKCVLRWDNNGKVFQNYKPESLRQECEDSLRRLNADVIDLYQLHWPPDKNEALIDGAWEMMARLKEEGKVRWIGVTGAMTRERIENLSAEDWRLRWEEFKEPKITKNLELADKLKEIGKTHNATAGEIAISWTLKHPAVTGAIVGARSAAQVDGVMNVRSFKLDEDEVNELEAHFSGESGTD
jgi:aryl-alcohol dehydrogenase-like predicted oxidoreductase